MPHGYVHENLTEVPLERAQNLILRCLEYFERALDGFDPTTAVFNFPYNASSPAIEEWLGDRVMAFRTGYARINPLPRSGLKKLICHSHGPDNMDAFLEQQVDRFLASAGGWLIFNTHGLDGEGWGPLSSAGLDRLLGRLTAVDHVLVTPTGRALAGL